MNGPDPLQPGVILDWCRATGAPLNVTEIEIILEMDAAYRVACAREAAEQSAKGKER